MRIYVASSWRNTHQSQVVKRLRELGHEVYDFREPEGPGSEGFHWKDVGIEIGNEDWKTWTTEQYMKALRHPIAINGFDRDFDALEPCQVCIFVAPAGVSASLELGYACGAAKETIVYLPEMLREADLMFKMADLITDNWNKVEGYLIGIERFN